MDEYMDNVSNANQYVADASVNVLNVDPEIKREYFSEYFTRATIRDL